MVTIVLLLPAGQEVLLLMLFVLLYGVFMHVVMLMLVVVYMVKVKPGVGVADVSGFIDGVGIPWGLCC